jgi:hypothetical protein
VRNQVALAEFVTKDVVQRLQSQVEELRAQLPGARPVKKAAKKAPVRKAAAKKAPAKKAAVKKAVARKAPAKRAPSKKSAS